MSKILDRYALLTGLHWKGEATQKEMDEQHKLYLKIAKELDAQKSKSIIEEDIGGEIPFQVMKLQCSQCEKSEPHGIYEHMGRLLYE